MGKNNNRTRGNALAMVSLNGTGAAAALKAADTLTAVQAAAAKVAELAADTDTERAAMAADITAAALQAARDKVVEDMEAKRKAVVAELIAEDKAADDKAAAEILDAAAVAAKMAALPVFDSPKSVKEITALLSVYLTGDKIKELGKLSGGGCMNQILMDFYAVTGFGLTTTDLAAALKASGNTRKNVNGHLQIFAKSKDSEPRKLCPKGLRCWKENGRYCIERIIPKAAAPEVATPEAAKA